MHTTFALAVGADGTNAALRSSMLQGKTCIRRHITVTVEASVCLPETMHPTVALVDQDEDAVGAHGTNASRCWRAKKCIRRNIMMTALWR